MMMYENKKYWGGITIYYILSFFLYKCLKYAKNKYLLLYRDDQRPLEKPHPALILKPHPFDNLRHYR